MFFYEKYLRSLRIPRESFVALISFMAMAMPWAVIAADSYTWTGGGANNNWNTAANWGLASGSPNAVDATINFGASSRYTPNLNRNTTIGYFVIDSATQYSINGNGMRRVTLDVSSGNAGVIIGGGGGVTHIYNKQMIWNDHVDIDVAADTGFTFADTISGSSSGFTKTGAGTLNLADQNSFTGGISLLGGVVSITADNRLGNVANDITFDGGMLQTTGAFTFNAGRTFTFD
ncbi:MAG: autotransporter-associated beta strand repeat-containing protein, partial [Verrucomicrobiales bacterium]